MRNCWRMVTSGWVEPRERVVVRDDVKVVAIVTVEGACSVRGNELVELLSNGVIAEESRYPSVSPTFTLYQVVIPSVEPRAVMVPCCPSGSVLIKDPPI